MGVTGTGAERALGGEVLGSESRWGGRSHDTPAGGVRPAAGDRGQAEAGEAGAGAAGEEGRGGVEIRAGPLLREAAGVGGGPPCEET